MDAIELLTQDHRRVDELFLRYQPLTGDAASARERKRLVAEITRELSVHAAIEERKLYPVVRESVPNGEGMADEAESEHAQVKATLAELEELDPDAPDFDAAVARLIEDVQHHVKEEENELFPKLREALDASRLQTLGRELAQARKSAPKRPSKADRSTTSMVANMAAAALGRMRTAIGGMTGAGEAASGGAKRRSRAGGRKTAGAGRTAKSRTKKSRATSTKSRSAGTRSRAAKAGTGRARTAAKRTSAGAAGGRARSRRRAAGAGAASRSRTRRGAAAARTARGTAKRRGAAKTRRSARATNSRSRATAARGRKTARVTARRGRAAASRAKKRAATSVKRGTGARRKTGGKRR